MPVQMQLSRIIISEINEQQVIYLKEVEGERTFPILIGIFEAHSIDRRVKQNHSPRPLTHDLLVNTVESLGAELQDVVISELKDHTYYAKLRVRKEGELIDEDGSQRPGIYVGEAETSAWFGGAPSVIVVHPDTKSGEQVAVVANGQADLRRIERTLLHPAG